MRAEYKRDMNHNYLILHEEEELDTTSYQVRMLLGNAIPSILKSRVQGIDGKFMIYYDITSRQSVSALFEDKKLKYEDLKLIFSGFVQVMEEMSEYLLNPGHLVIQPEYMYVDVENREMFFCYLPGFEGNVKVQFQSLAEYLLPKVDHEDNQAVMLAYGVYRRALEEIFRLENIKEELYREREEESGTDKAAEKKTAFYAAVENEKKLAEKHQKRKNESQNEEMKPRIWEEEEERYQESVAEKNYWEDEKEEKSSIWIKALGCVLGALAVLIVVAAEFLGYLPQISMEVMLGIIIAVMGGGMLLYTMLRTVTKKQRHQEVQSKEKSGNLFREYPETEIYKNEEENEWDFEEKKSEKHMETENYGETVVLSVGRKNGPASLVSKEPGELASIYLEEDLIVIGKLANASDAVIDRPTVSRVHAKIRRRDGEYYLTDLNSRNGTSVNGKLLKNNEEYLLQNEDEVDFAEARYIFLK